MTYHKNLDLDAASTREFLMAFVNSHIAPSKMIPVTNREDINSIREGDYVVMPGYSGIRSWIILHKKKTRNITNYYACTTNRTRAGGQLFSIEADFSEDMYNGTIMEGIFFTVENEKFLVVDDIYLLAGVTQLLRPKQYRLQQLSEHFVQTLRQNQSYHIYVNNCYEITHHDLTMITEKIKSVSNISEIIFAPQSFGKMIYTYTLQDNDVIDDIVKYATFLLRKSTIPDVYKIYTSNETRVGIAYIPDKDTSQMCRNWFKNQEELYIKCRFHHDRQKWIPIALSEPPNIVDSESESKPKPKPKSKPKPKATKRKSRAKK